MKVISATAERDGSWWALSAKVGGREIWTQCRRLDQAERVLREAVEMSLGRSVPQGALSLDILLDERSHSIIEKTLRATAAAATAQRVASEESRRAVRDLRAEGFTVRDCAELLGVSPTRISQLLAH